MITPTAPFLVSVLACGVLTPTALPQDQALTEAQRAEIAKDTYLYAYPLVLMDLTRRQLTNVEPGVENPATGPMMEFTHRRAFPTADAREVVRPNFDTLYSSVWLDLREEPAIISVPEVEGRFYMLPLLDMWTDVFAVIGTRVTGTTAQSFAITPRNWRGDLPAGVTRIEAPTPFAWIIGRTQTNGVSDYPAVRTIQDGLALTTLSRFGDTPRSVRGVFDRSIEMRTPPPMQIQAMPAEHFFAYAAELMKLHPPHASDFSMVARMARLGIVVGESLDFDALPAASRKALDMAPMAAAQAMQATLTNFGTVVNGWKLMTTGMGVYGNDYAVRAAIAMIGLGANPPEEAVYPLNIADSDGMPLDAANVYVLRFEKEELPPVDAFWSVTMYDAEGYQVPNPLNRFALGDRDELKFGADGSLEIYIQHVSPGTDREANWLPAPVEGILGVTMRLYAPRDEALNGTWKPPMIRRIK